MRGHRRPRVPGVVAQKGGRIRRADRNGLIRVDAIHHGYRRYAFSADTRVFLRWIYRWRIDEIAVVASIPVKAFARVRQRVLGLYCDAEELRAVEKWVAGHGVEAVPAFAVEGDWV